MDKSKIKIFSSFEEENKTEHQRLANMSGAERMREFGILQERAFGKDWAKTPMVKTATYEMVDWFK